MRLPQQLAKALGIAFQPGKINAEQVARVENPEDGVAALPCTPDNATGGWP
jgi:hypothetical protein